ncbi:MAG: sugar phosphate isomerase/epimerase [Bryobacterales bacterium]|nr:sugar phosphate isomerase/epimerase [Bryobacterales bacterium]
MDRRSFLTFPAMAAASMQTSGGGFRKGICDVIVPKEMPLEQAFALVKRGGFDGLEITMGPKLKLDTPWAELKTLAKAAADAGVTIITISVSQPFANCPLNHPDSAVRAQGVDVIKKSVDIAHVLGAGTILLVPSRVGSGAKFLYGYEETWKRTSEELPKAIPHAAQAKVILTPENVWNKFLLSPLEMRRFVDQFKSPWLQAHFDIGNVVQFGYPQDWIATLGKRIQRIHLKDFKVQTNKFVPLMEGDVAWKDVVDALVKIGYRGWMSPEYTYNAGDPEEINRISKAVDRIYGLAG